MTRLIDANKVDIKTHNYGLMTKFFGRRKIANKALLIVINKHQSFNPKNKYISLMKTKTMQPLTIGSFPPLINLFRLKHYAHFLSKSTYVHPAYRIYKLTQQQINYNQWSNCKKISNVSI
ncbi:unnamed protein product [Wuchereria bancrofti]|uniref:Uncharacterized protein n=1 Tax=Wuchereria bancrofti TaxID=6293 RepID=A0A3P7DDP1_WUCBA|nr:unnamed protein product [Wuchereria bancrofti]